LHKEHKLKEEKDGDKSDKEENSTILTNQIELVTPEIKPIYHENLHKKFHLDKSHTIKAFEILDSLF
jgi:hypothetical protein